MGMNNPIEKLLSHVVQTIFDKKGWNILLLDLRATGAMTDYVIIAEGTVDRHVNALCKAVIERLEKEGLYSYRIEGQRTADWIVLDYSDFVIHLFTPEFREKYALEQLWHEAKIVDVNIMTGEHE